MRFNAIMTAGVCVFAGFILGAWVAGDGDGEVSERLGSVEQRLEALEQETRAAGARSAERIDALGKKIETLGRATDASEYKTLTISRVYWADSPERRALIPDAEFKPRDDGSGHVFMHVDELRPNQGVSQYRPFYDQADKSFVLRADGEDDVALSAERGMWMQEFYLRIPPDELAKMKAGVTYTLEPLNLRPAVKWATRGRLSLSRE